MIELDAETPLQKIEYGLYPWVTLVIIPLIALANAGMLINSTFVTALLDPVSLGVAIGLLLGKFVGFIYMVDGEVRNCGFTTICHWRHITEVAIPAGPDLPCRYLLRD